MFGLRCSRHTAVRAGSARGLVWYARRAASSHLRTSICAHRFPFEPLQGIPSPRAQHLALGVPSPSKRFTSTATGNESVPDSVREALAAIERKEEGKARAKVDLRSCLFAECSGDSDSGEHMSKVFSSGADAVALDAFALNDNEELADVVLAAADAIQSGATPAYQLHFLQVDANVTEDSPVLPKPSERQERLKKRLQSFLSANKPVDGKKNGGRAFDGLVLRNIQNAADVGEVERMVEECDAWATEHQEQRLTFILVLESPLSYFASLQIAESSDRTIAIVGSSPLFSESVECQDNSHNETIMAMKVSSTLAAHTAGIVSLSGWQSGDEDPARLSRLAVSDRNTGIDGKVILNRPDLVPFVNHLYTIPELEIQLADELVAIDGGTTRTGKHKENAALVGEDSETGVRQFKGPPHKAMAKALLRKWKLQQPKLEEASRLVLNQTGMKVPSFIRGRLVDRVTHERLQVGDVIRCPYELTIDESWITMWHMLVYNPRTSEFSAKHKSRLGTHRPVLPYALAQLLCIGLSVSKLTEKARFHLGTYDNIMVRPLEAGDMFRSFVRVDKKSWTADGYLVLDTTHVLVNQDDKLQFSSRKKTMFPSNPSEINSEAGKSLAPTKLVKPESKVRQHLLARPLAELMATQGQQQAILEPGQVFVHRLVRYLDKYDCIYFSNLCRLTNDFHINFFKYETEQLIVPGPLVMYCAIGNSLPDLGEQIYHELDLGTHINKFSPGDSVGTISYIADVKTLPENDALEEVTIKQIGIKNVDMEMLANERLPKALFALDLVRPSDYEKICRAHCPVLQRRIVVTVIRRFIRVKPSAMQAAYDDIQSKEMHAVVENKWFD